METYGNNVIIKISGYCKIEYDTNNKKIVSNMAWKKKPNIKKTKDLNGCYIVPNNDYIILDMDDIYFDNDKIKSLNHQIIIDNYFDNMIILVNI